MSDTRDVIQARLLSNIDNTYDTTEGSFFYDSEMPVAIELESAYQDQENILNDGFADTATGIYLDKIVGEQGITRKLATYATTTVTVIGSIGAVINIGDKVASDTVSFTFSESKTIDSTGQAIVHVVCITAGSIGNVPVGAIKYFPVTLSGLNSVTNPYAVADGYDEETDDELRERYYTKVQTPATSGNKNQYVNWAKEVTGVGDARCEALWNGNGTVKVVIINSNKRAADSTLISTVINHIEDNRPIGAMVTVVSAVEKPVNVSATLTIDTINYVLNEVQTEIQNNLIAYFANTAFINNYISYANIGNIIFSTNGVLDYGNLLVNASTSNLIIGQEEVAVLGVLTVG